MILLDSHVFFWWATDDKRLSRLAHDTIQNEPGAHVSAVVAWEIASKVRAGKWPEAQLLASQFFVVLQSYRFLPLAITLQHAHRAGSLSGRHRDPFDRMLVAQAQLEGLRIVSADAALRELGAEIVW